MVRVTSEKESARRRIEGSINAFLNGKKNLNWIVGVIRENGVSNEDLRNMFSTFRISHAENKRFQELEKACKQLGII